MPWKILGLPLLILSLSSCSFSLDWYRLHRAESAAEKQDYSTALELYKKIIASDPDNPRALKAARKGAHVAHLEAKDYVLAVEFYKQIILQSTDSEERKNAQKMIAQIHFENLQDYSQAVAEYEKLLKLDHHATDAFNFRLNLAKSQLRLNNIDQALTEIDILLSQQHTPDEMFEAKVLKANTIVASKRMTEAAGLWEDIMKQFPEKSQKENVALNLVVCYEEMNEFKKAIEVLERMRPGYPHPDFLDLRIQRLKERMKNQPGAQGLKR